MQFEIKAKDGLARLGVISVNNKKINTPVLLPVVNPHLQLISPKELQEEFGCEALITNAFILHNSKSRDEILKKGIHKFLDFDGVIMTDSGTFQQYSHGEVPFSNEETLEFQKKIGSDILTFMDVFTLPDDNRETVLNKVKETFERAKFAVDYDNVNCAVQGGLFLDIRKKNASELNKMNFKYYSAGGIVPLMENYNYEDLVKVILAVRKNLSSDRTLHAFGAGHPTLFPLLALLGCDVFDSASYAIFAKKGKYLTEFGTKDLDELNELPCVCPVCSAHKISEFDEKLLAKHNLWVLMGTIKKVRQAIHEGKLWELVDSFNVHPELSKAVKFIYKNSKVFFDSDPVRKRSTVYNLSSLSKLRPEILRAKKIIKDVFKCEKIPSPLKYTFPFNSYSFHFKFDEKKRSDEQWINDILSFQFRQKISLKGIVIERSKKTGAIRHVHKNNKLLMSLRAGSGLFSLNSDGAKELFSCVKNFHVVVSDDVSEFARNGKDVFSRFVVSAAGILSKDEVFVVNSKNELLAFGEAVLSGNEMLDFKSGSAVKVRKGFKQ